MADATLKLASPIASVRVIDASGAGAPVEPPSAEVAAEAERTGKALEAERAELARTRAALAAALSEAIKLRDSVVAAAEKQIVQLAIDVARKVLMQEIQAGRYEIDPVVRAALEQVTTWREVVVHLNPDDLSRCSLAAQADGEGDGDETGPRFVADPGVKPAECLLETPQGVVRSAVEEHLGEIASALAEPEPT